MFSLKNDYETTKERYDAFWNGAIVDRAPANITIPVENPAPVPEREYPSLEKRWTDISFRAEQIAIDLANREYLGDALPIAWPNMGPEIFSAWCGCPYNFGETTTWSEPCISDWQTEGANAVFNPEHPLYLLTVEFTRELIARGKGKFIVGLTDFHSGGDHIAALRDPEALAMDMIENLDFVKAKLEESAKQYFNVYDGFYNMLREAGMPITSWTPLIHEGKYYIPSNDFSCMISTEMFEEVFLPGIIDECRFLDRSIYHLDGPGALRHLDLLLSIPELDAVQWVPGAGNEGFARWIDVYKRIQGAGKSLQIINISLDELPLLFENLQPEGTWLSSISGVKDGETAEQVLDRITRWE